MDSHSYNETLMNLDCISPDEILLHDGSRNRVLSRKVEDRMAASNSRVLFVSRQYFDQDRGAELLKNVIVGEVDADLIAKYTVLAGCFCLLRYVENCRGVNFARQSLRYSRFVCIRDCCMYPFLRTLSCTRQQQDGVLQ
jgi:hypothetical protein